MDRDGVVGPAGRTGPLLSGLLAGLAALVLGCAPARAQEEPPGPARPDTTPRAEEDQEGPDPVFPDRRVRSDTRAVGDVQRWTREELLASDAVTLQDFLADRVPGVLPLRSSYYFGPHQLLDGLYGPGFLRLVVDGRELHPLETGQPDLARIALARVDRLAVVRRAGETVVRVTTPTYRGGDAYSRISGGTGRPAADLISGVFMNGAGRSFSVAGTVDHLTIGQSADRPGDRLDVSGRLAWMPDPDTGVELVYHSDAVTRPGVVSEDFDRRDILIHARGSPATGLQLDLWAGRSSRSPRPTTDAPGTDPPTGADDEEGRPGFDVDHVELGLSFQRGPVQLSADARTAGADGLPDVDAGARGSLEISESVSLHASADLSSWADFQASSVSGGISVRPGGADAPFTVRAEGATGSRGVPRPGRAADSVSFDALAGTAEIRLGPYRISGRGSYQELDRQLPFGGDFDAALEPGPSATVVGVEGRVEGPLLPVAAIAERLRVHGSWRHQEPRDGADPFYLPADLARGELRVRDEFFRGNLEVSGALRLRYRSEMLSAEPGQPGPVPLPERQSFGSSLALQIDTFRIWWRVDNLQREVQRDFADLRFPENRSVFGITWEFFN